MARQSELNQATESIHRNDDNKLHTLLNLSHTSLVIQLSVILSKTHTHDRHARVIESTMQ